MTKIITSIVEVMKEFTLMFRASLGYYTESEKVERVQVQSITLSPGTKSLSSHIGKQLIDEGTSKIKNKNVERCLNLMSLIMLFKKPRKGQKKTSIICLVGYEKRATVSVIFKLKKH